MLYARSRAGTAGHKSPPGLSSQKLGKGCNTAIGVRRNSHLPLLEALAQMVRPLKIVTDGHCNAPAVNFAKGATTGGRGSGSPKIWRGHPNFFDEECDYRYVTDCSSLNWVHHPYFVLYNNLDQGIGPPTLQTWLRP